MFMTPEDEQQAKSQSVRKCANCRLWVRKPEDCRGFCQYLSMGHQITTDEHDICDHHKYRGEL